MKTFALLLAAAVAFTTCFADETPAAPVVRRTNTFLSTFPVPAYIIEKLALTPDQQTKFENLKTQYATDYQAVSAKVQAATRPLWDELRALKPGENPDRRRELSQQLTGVNQPILDLNAQYKTKFADLLTPDQKTKFTALDADAKLPQLVFVTILDKVQLTPEQEAKYRDIVKDFRAELQKTGDQRKKLFEEYQTAAKAGDKEKTTDLQKQSTELFKTDAATRARCLEQFKALLTDEQKTRYEEASHSASRPHGPMR
jgi:Spy/CpxP family protein refolding chaperone